MDIRDIAIIAHVDHGKTTLVDGMLKQTHTFRDNQAEMQQTTILDSNDLERERGITILAKNTSVSYNGVKINIVDTPGHADFGGEVERVLNMADAALLIVDAAEGPLPQTKFVLQKALQAGLKIILVINKIDKKDARPAETLQETEELFLKLATTNKHLEFPVVYAIGRDGKAWKNLPSREEMDKPGDLAPLFETILETVSNGVVKLDQPLQMLISTIDYDTHLGKLAVGRIRAGVLKIGQRIVLSTPTGNFGNFSIAKLYINVGITRVAVNEAGSGEIVAIAGINEFKIGQTVTDPSAPTPLPEITIDEPTLKLTIGANTSPMAGREGKFVTSRQIGQRLDKEAEINLGMRFTDLGGGIYEVIGRGELHLAILLETLRREGFEMQVSRPMVILKDKKEPYEEIYIEVPDEYVGVITSEMGRRRGEMRDMGTDHRGSTLFTYLISQRNMIGVRNNLLTQTKGTVVLNSSFMGYQELGLVAENVRNGVLVALDAGKVLAYSLENAQQRGITFVEPGEEVYAGMIVGLGTRDQDVELNMCKGKHLTNTRAASADIRTILTPATKMSLEQALDFIGDDELLELTPNNIRVRKKYLTKLDRVRNARKERSADQSSKSPENDEYDNG